MCKAVTHGVVKAHTAFVTWVVGEVARVELRCRRPLLTTKAVRYVGLTHTHTHILSNDIRYTTTAVTLLRTYGTRCRRPSVSVWVFLRALHYIGSLLYGFYCCVGLWKCMRAVSLKSR